MALAEQVERANKRNADAFGEIMREMSVKRLEEARERQELVNREKKHQMLEALWEDERRRRKEHQREKDRREREVSLLKSHVSLICPPCLKSSFLEPYNCLIIGVEYT